MTDFSHMAIIDLFILFVGLLLFGRPLYTGIALIVVSLPSLFIILRSDDGTLYSEEKIWAAGKLVLSGMG